MTRARLAAAGLFTLIALFLALFLLSLAAGLPETYGPGASDGLVVFAAFPAMAAFGAAVVTGGNARPLVVAAVFSVLLAAGVPLAGRWGAGAWTDRMVAGDAGFTCNGPHAEVQVPEDVDAAWHAMSHPSPFWLYGPVQGSPHGCTAAIHEASDEAFAAWRAALLATGWRVVRDDTEVVVQRDGVRLTLFVQDDLAHLQTDSSSATTCRPSTSDDGQVSAC